MIHNTDSEDGLNIQLLLNAVDNDDNEHLMNLTTQQIQNSKNNILQQLQLDRHILKSYHKKLKQYRYVSELHEIRYGSYIRWINLKRDELKLTNGGILCDTVVTENGLHIKCKNNRNRFFQFNFEECIVFQKLNDQEKILLSILDYLNE